MLLGCTGSVYRGTKSNDMSQECFQSRTIVCYTRERVKREEKEILQHQTTSLCIQFRLLPSNHSPCSDVPFKSSFVFLHNISQLHYQNTHATTSDVATLVSPSSSYPYHLHYSYTISGSLRSSRTFVPTSCKCVTCPSLIPAYLLPYLYGCNP